MSINNTRPREFWVSNLSKRDVALSDLRVTIPAHRSINLLDNRHYHLTENNIELSVASGSISKRKSQNLIAVRDVPPEQIVKPGVYIYKGPMPRRVERKINKVEVPEYEELNFSDEKFANENIDAVVEDSTPVLPKK